MANQILKKPELLAPAGSIEAFHAAIEAGADAVYLGLNNFNARLRAKNFTTKTLAYLVPFAHQKNVKVHVTLNIQIKQMELENVVHLLYQLDQIGADAVIVADLGVIDIARTSFPNLVLHGSTQMAIHNSAGVRMAEKLGLKRVVLARELSLKEICLIKNSSNIELETFIHGALCYGISGNCLASSMFGGSSGNRGRCTQVCRRKFVTAHESGYFFSPKDFCGIEFLSLYEDAGVSCLKIEGRMKGPEYVHTVVKAYRKVIDDASRISESKKELTLDMGRQKTTLFLDESNREQITDSKMLPGTGILLGCISQIESGCITLDTEFPVEPGDRIRIHPQNGFDGYSVNVLSIRRSGGSTELDIKETEKMSQGDSVYLISKKSNYSELDQSRKIATNGVLFKECYQKSASVVRRYRKETISQTTRNELWIKIDNCEWIPYLQATPCQHLIFSGSSDQILNLITAKEYLSVWRSRLYPELPPYISENDLPKWRDIIKLSKESGVKRWACTNISHLKMFSSDFELIADNPIWSMNAAAQSVLLNIGFSKFTYSIEDEYLNIKSIPYKDGIMYLYGHIPLFISRINPSLKTGTTVTDPHMNSFFITEKEGLYYSLTCKPFGIANKKAKLSELGIHHFCIDLSFTECNQNQLLQLIDSYKNGTRMPGTELYNFKAGLK